MKDKYKNGERERERERKCNQNQRERLLVKRGIRFNGALFCATKYEVM